MYVVSYYDDYGGEQQFKILNYEQGLTWRELQQRFDPSFRYNSLEFYLLGSAIIS